MAIWGPPVKNLTPSFAPPTSISHKTDVFPLPSDVHGIYLTFLCYYVAWPCDLDLWRFDSWQWIRDQVHMVHILKIRDFLNVDHFPPTQV